MKYTTITIKEIDVKFTACWSIIKYDIKFCAGKDSPNIFDVTTSLDSAQLTDLVGIYLLSIVHDEFTEIEGGLNKDDALLIVENLSDSLQVVWPYHYISKRMCFINFLDANVNLHRGLHEPF